MGLCWCQAQRKAPSAANPPRQLLHWELELACHSHPVLWQPPPLAEFGRFCLVLPAQLRGQGVKEGGRLGKRLNERDRGHKTNGVWIKVA